MVWPKDEPRKPRELGGLAAESGLGPEGTRVGIPERFTIQERLGTGGFGSVFAVIDQKNGRRLALKRLERVDAHSIYRFKQEFRVVSGRPHPNLVRLHELVAEDGYWCFTMDEVRGVPFDTWVSGQSAPREGLSSTQSTGSSHSGAEKEKAAAPTSSPPTSPRPLTPGSEERLRAALPQLIAGLLELHGRGILHRDLKPSNVLVDRGGRVVILDFGLALPVTQDTSNDSFAGTPAYMSPEQASGAALTVASDWYAVGVLLYQALTGRLPFAGTRKDMMRARRQREPRDPRKLNPALPEDLCNLTMSLLARAPSDRPTGAEIGARAGIRPSAAARPEHLRGEVFVGRLRELELLRKGLERVRGGQTVVARIGGPSGFGKTALIKKFVASISITDEVVVLEGSCFQKETVPFKAWDDLADSLGRYLESLQPEAAAALLPRDIRSLVRLFPSLGRLRVLDSFAGRPADADGHEARRRAFSALRELMTRISDVLPLIVVLDDAHWGDADSADVLRHLLAPPDVPRFMLLASYRTEADQQAGFLQALRALDRERELVTIDISLSGLGVEDAERLARALLGQAEPDPKEVRLIVEESARSPLFVAELARAARRRQRTDGLVTLNDVLGMRARNLSEDAHRTLITLCASERPLAVSQLAHACSSSAARVTSALEHLCDEHLALPLALPGASRFSVAHDKVRQAVLEPLSEPERASLHLRLARTFAAEGRDVEAIAFHFAGAGAAIANEPGVAREACIWSERAGDAAAASTAFHQSLVAYRRALGFALPRDELRLQAKIANSLGMAGFAMESAQLHERLADRMGTDGEQHRLRSGQQYLLAGATTEAQRVWGPRLERHGLGLPGSSLWVMAGLLLRRAALKTRALRFRPRPGQASAEAREGVELAWALANGFAGIDVLLSVHYTTITVSRALNAGEAHAVARSLALDSILRIPEGSQGLRDAEPLLQRAEELALASGQNHALGWVSGARAIGALVAGDFPTAHELCTEAIALLRQSSELSFREIGTLSCWFWLYPLLLMGRLDQVAEHGPAIAREAEERGDAYTLSTVRAFILPWLYAARGRVAEARREADSALEVWPPHAWVNQHWAHVRTHCFLDLYEGRGEKVEARARSAESRMRKALHLRIHAMRVDHHYLLGRGALDAHLAERPTGARPPVSKQIEALRRERSVLANLYADTLQAGAVALVDHAEGERVFARLAVRHSELAMPLHASACRLRVGELRGLQSVGHAPSESATANEPAAGYELRQRALEELRAGGVAEPSRYAAMIVPRVH